MLAINKETGIPLAEGIETVLDLPHTITSAIAYRMKLNSFHELPEDKQPPRGIWDKPYRLSLHFKTVWDTKKEGSDTSSEFYEFDLEDVE